MKGHLGPVAMVWDRVVTNNTSIDSIARNRVWSEVGIHMDGERVRTMTTSINSSGFSDAVYRSYGAHDACKNI